MATRLKLNELTQDQKLLIRYACIYSYDLSNKARKTLSEMINRLDVNGGVKSFALVAFCSELDEQVIKYLGGKFNDIMAKKRGESKSDIQMYEPLSNGDVLVPYAFARLLIGENKNLLIPYPEIPGDRVFRGELRDHQSALTETMLTHLRSSGTTTMNVYPGAGKTIMGIYLTIALKKVTIVMITLVALIKSWKTTVERFTNLKLWIVGEGECPSDVDVLICMDERIHKIPKEIRMKIGTVIIDEAHLFCVPSRRTKWLAFEPHYLIIETATLKRPEDNMERMAYACAGLWGVTLRSSKEFIVHGIKTGLKGERQSNKIGGVDFTHLLQTILYRDEMNGFIRDIVNKHSKERILILTKEKDHVDKISMFLQEIGRTSSKYYGSLKKYPHSDILIGTPSKMGTGFDEATFDDDFKGDPVNVLILTSTIKKFSTLEQNVGRVLRADAPIVYVFIHDDNIFNGHWYLMRWYFSEHMSAIIN